MNERFYLLKIQLLEIEPAIWRRFVVPGSITLDRLHDVIQIVMGWKDSHLHEFTIGKQRYTEFPENREDGLASGKYRLVDLIKRKGRTFIYTYDFGEDWRHELTIEDSRYTGSGWPAPIFCLEGENACPPEDVGGIPGFFEFCRAMKDPTHEAHEQYMTWWGEPYDREEFNVNAVNQELLKYLRWSRNRYLRWDMPNDMVA